MSSPEDGSAESDDRAEDIRRSPEANEPEPSGDPRSIATSDSTSDSQEPWQADRDDAPPHRRGRDADDGGWELFVYDLISSVLAVFVVGAYLFSVSGVWPPLVAVESGSMEPNMQVNDLVFVMEETRFPGESEQGNTGVVTARAAEDHRMFGARGDVIVYAPDGNTGRTPIIHRAMFWVDDGENWYDRADPADLGPADSCAALANCPAPHAGFVTKGDNNGQYDQSSGLSEPVQPEWVVGTAEIRIPGLGWVRLRSAN